MRRPRFGTPDRPGLTLRGPRGAALGALLLLLAACSSSPDEISADNLPPAPAISPDPCGVVPRDAVTAALALPSSAELSASGSALAASTVSPAPAPKGVSGVTSVGSHSNLGQCTYQSATGPTLVVTVFPKASLAALTDYTAGLRPLGSAYLGATGTSGLVAVQDGPAVVGIALDVGGVSGDVVARRLATVANAVTGEQLPVPALSASSSQAPAAPVPTPLPAAGEQVTGQTPAQTVQETAGLKFDPGSVTVSAGGVVQWTNAGTAPHNVTFDADPELTSGTMNAGDRYQVKFSRAGQYPYHCTFHPGMDGTITVS